jgi:membrane associated rhomboid family serine protease/Tfp pilus assembly protein PilF
MIIPIGHEDQQVRRLPWVTIVLVAVNVAVFLLTNELAHKQATEMGARGEEIVRYVTTHPHLTLSSDLRGGVRQEPLPPDHSLSGLAEEQARLNGMVAEFRASARRSVFWTYGYVPADPNPLGLFTSMFLHAGWLHLLGNLLFLWLAGGRLEDRWGRVFFPAFYLVCGVAAALLHAAMIPESRVPMVGASGAIAGLMGALLIHLVTRRSRLLSGLIVIFWLIYWSCIFAMPDYVVLPPWLLQQFSLARSGTAGDIAVWAHLGGFASGAVIVLGIWLSGFEAKLLGRGETGKSGWGASDQLTAALGLLDGGNADGAIRALVALLRKNPNNIEARTALIGAYAQKGDSAAADRESARLISAYVAVRDMEGALAAREEHGRAHPGVDPSMRSLLALAAYREMQGQHAEAAELYQQAIQAWPDDLLAPKALVNHGRLLLEAFHEPDAALEILEQVRTHPKVTPEFERVSEELMTAARGARPVAAPQPETAAIPMPEPEPARAAGPERPGLEGFEGTAHFEAPPAEETPQPATSQEEPSAAGWGAITAQIEMPASATSRLAEPQPAPAPAAADTSQGWLSIDEPSVESPAEAVIPPVVRTLAPTSMQAVGIDARGVRLKSRAGTAGLLQWQQIVGISTARIEGPAATEQPGDHLVLDLLMAPESAPDGEVVRCVRLSGQDLAIPQLQNEPSPLRGFQRFVATALKASSATPYPSREECLGLQGFATFSDLAAYEAALLTRLA